VGVVDALRLDPATGLVSLTETKTRKTETLPSSDQVRSARMQVCVCVYVCVCVCMHVCMRVRACLHVRTHVGTRVR